MKWLHKYGQCLGLDSQLCYLVALLNFEKLAVEVFLSREQGNHIKCDVLCVSEGCVREGEDEREGDCVHVTNVHLLLTFLRY